MPTDVQQPIPREQLRTSEELARQIDRTDAYLKGLRRELAPRPPAPATDAQVRRIDREWSQEPERWDGMS